MSFLSFVRKKIYVKNLIKVHFGVDHHTMEKEYLTDSPMPYAEEKKEKKERASLLCVHFNVDKQDLCCLLQ